MSTDPVFDIKAHNIISVEKVLQLDSDAIQKLNHEFKTKGWCIIDMPNPEAESAIKEFRRVKLSHFKPFIYNNDTIASLSKFFLQEKSNKDGNVGYSAVPHKESIHLTTPSWLVKDKLHESVAPLLQEWMGGSDQIAMDLIEVLCKTVFGCDKPTLAHRADMPVGYGTQVTMLDIAYYKNEKTATLSPEIGHSTEDVNCVPHYDPGLLSLSFLSTHDGLQLQDPSTGTWYAGPVNTRKGEENLAVIWLGAAAVTASKGTLKAGVHRVVYPQTSAPRIACWFELCTVEQVNQETQCTIQETGKLKLPNLPGSKPLTMVGDRRLIERHYGIPMSKVMRRSDAFAAYYSADKKEKDDGGFRFNI